PYCEKCGVDFNISKNEARSRFGHIQLCVPVVHVWFYKFNSSILSVLLNETMEYIQDLIDYKLHIIISTLTDKYKIGQVIDTDTYYKIWDQRHVYKVLSGAPAILELLSKVQPQQLKKVILSKYKELNSQKDLNDLNDKLNIINNFNNTNDISSKIIINFLPVLPVPLRPAIILPDSTYTSSDLNELYKRIISINNSIRSKLTTLKIGKTVNFHKYLNNFRKLQYAINALIDSTSGTNKSTGYNAIALKSLSDLLKGKKGRFRYNILGKRVDYSGRSVIAPGPGLLLNECAIPRIMALKLFKPFIYTKLMLRFGIKETKVIKSIITNNPNIKNSILDEVVRYWPIILNRAPTLHKLSIRAFWVKLTNEKVIRLHPLTCVGFNADFDGDQMAAHVPLSFNARIEVILLMISTRNIFHPAHGKPCILPTQDMVMGLYYMSLVSLECKDICFTSYADVVNALLFKKVDLHTKVKFTLVRNGSHITIVSTPGRLLIMEAVPLECNFIYTW
ncbi:MAG: DNA-directed RNA polymerase subunit beta', partial [Candidatus Hodgkinia cicadicola]